MLQSVLSFHHVGSGDWTQVIRLGGKLFHLLSQFSGSLSSSLMLYIVYVLMYLCMYVCMFVYVCSIITIDILKIEPNAPICWARVLPMSYTPVWVSSSFLPRPEIIFAPFEPYHATENARSTILCQLVHGIKVVPGIGVGRPYISSPEDT